MRIIFIIVGLVVGTSIWASPLCPSRGDNIGLRYQRAIQNTDQTVKSPLTVWRRGHQVAVHYQNTDITELWDQSAAGTIRLTRFFNKYQRGIEYQPGEINDGKYEQDWSLKWQLLSDSVLAKMQLKHSDEIACGLQQELELNEVPDQVTQLTWLPAVKVVKVLDVESGQQTISWHLQEVINDKKVVSDFFQELSSFQTVDYADIGDNESDPFLRQMIHLGFIEHGHSEGNGSPGHRH